MRRTKSYSLHRARVEYLESIDSYGSNWKLNVFIHIVTITTHQRQNLTIGAGRPIHSNSIAVFTLFHIKDKRDITYFSSSVCYTDAVHFWFFYTLCLSTFTARLTIPTRFKHQKNTRHNLGNNHDRPPLVTEREKRKNRAIASGTRKNNIYTFPKQSVLRVHFSEQLTGANSVTLKTINKR